MSHLIITEDHLNNLHKRLRTTLRGTTTQAVLIIIKWLKDNSIHLDKDESSGLHASIIEARHSYCDDDIKVNDDAMIIHTSDGNWVSAWLWIPNI